MFEYAAARLQCSDAHVGTLSTAFWYMTIESLYFFDLCINAQAQNEWARRRQMVSRRTDDPHLKRLLPSTFMAAASLQQLENLWTSSAP